MPSSADLHGNAPDQSPVVLLLIDFINDLEFPEGPKFLKPTLAAARQTAKLKKRAKALGVPVVYVNDNFGRWRSDFRDVTEHSLEKGVRGRRVASLLKPDPDDYFVLKPKHSAFFATTLDTLLRYLGARCLILTGIAADVCVFFTANDAYMRDLKLVVPKDCVASGSTTHTRNALQFMTRVLEARTEPSDRLDLEALLAEFGENQPTDAPKQLAGA
jgi:nicotinamidase-related amidase